MGMFDLSGKVALVTEGSLPDAPAQA